MRIALRVAGFSPTAFIRLKSSRQLRPASTRMRVRVEATIVLLPREPLASTVILTMRIRIQRIAVQDRVRNVVENLEGYWLVILTWRIQKTMQNEGAVSGQLTYYV